MTQISSSLKQLLKGLLQANPKDRITWDEFLYHPWITEKIDSSMECSEMIKSFISPNPNYLGGSHQNEIYIEN